MRKVEDEGSAQEISQNVSAALARKAWQFAPDDSLPAWLYKTTLLESKAWLRGELRRRRREQTAAELGTTMKTSDQQPALRALVPLLDEALLSLREKDRVALLLRFYENRPLREVGASLGIAEDTAQKRVAGALERLAQFFQRRGFRAATPAVTAALLQQTTTSTSATAAALVVNGVLESVPPALGGLMGLVARVTSLSNVQVAALCLAVVAVPVGWQWNGRRVAKQEAAQIQANLETAGLERTTLENEIRRLTETSERLSAALGQAKQLAAENAEAARKLESWKTRLRAALVSADYRWPEDSPFVRIPKSALRKLSLHMPISPPGTLKPETSELLGLSRQERGLLEEKLHRYFSDVDRMMEAGIYETNHSEFVRVPTSAVASRILRVPALGDSAKESGDLLGSELQDILGEQRWPLLESPLQSHGTHTLRRVLNLDSGQEAQEVAVWISPNAKGELTVGYNWGSKGSSFSTDGSSLASLLPGGDLEGGRSAIEDVKRNNLAGLLTQRMLAWLEEQAAARLGKETKP